MLTIIVLVSRSGKAKHYDGQHLEERLSKILQLGNGACVSIEYCDVSNEGELTSLLKQVRKKHGNINTVVHASGVLHDGWMQNMTVEDVRAHLVPKQLVHGTCTNTLRIWMRFGFLFSSLPLLPCLAIRSKPISL